MKSAELRFQEVRNSHDMILAPVVLALLIPAFVGCLEHNVAFAEAMDDVGYTFEQDLFHWWEPDAPHDEAAWAAPAVRPQGCAGLDRALARVRETFAETTQGPAWHCIPAGLLGGGRHRWR